MTQGEFSACFEHRCLRKKLNDRAQYICMLSRFLRPHSSGVLTCVLSFRSARDRRYFVYGGILATGFLGLATSSTAARAGAAACKGMADAACQHEDALSQHQHDHAQPHAIGQRHGRQFHVANLGDDLYRQSDPRAVWFRKMARNPYFTRRIAEPRAQECRELYRCQCLDDETVDGATLQWKQQDSEPRRCDESLGRERPRGPHAVGNRYQRRPEQ
jgi:hypothetical protein